MVTTTTYRFLIAPGRTAADYAAFGDRAAYHVAPAAAGPSYVLRILDGYLGGEVAQRMSRRQTHGNRIREAES
jgi:hypothetical protein